MQYSSNLTTGHPLLLYSNCIDGFFKENEADQHVRYQETTTFSPDNYTVKILNRTMTKSQILSEILLCVVFQCHRPTEKKNGYFFDHRTFFFFHISFLCKMSSRGKKKQPAKAAEETKPEEKKVEKKKKESEAEDKSIAPENKKRGRPSKKAAEEGSEKEEVRRMQFLVVYPHNIHIHNIIFRF